MTKPRHLRLLGTILSLLFAITATVSPAKAASSAKGNPSGVASSWRYADFDGDAKPDLIELRRTILELRLSSGKELRFASLLDAGTPGAEIVVVDLDGDNDLDIVVWNRFLKQHSDIWLNDGEGVFSRSATRDFSFPFDRGYWSQSPALDPGIAITARNSKPLAIVGDAWFLPPQPSFGAFHATSDSHAARNHTNTTHLRGPPHPSIR